MYQVILFTKIYFKKLIFIPEEGKNLIMKEQLIRQIILQTYWRWYFTIHFNILKIYKLFRQNFKNKAFYEVSIACDSPGSSSFINCCISYTALSKT